jgi:hypothetical protein
VTVEMKFLEFKGYEVKLIIDAEYGDVPFVRSVTILSLPEGPPVTTESLRSIPVARLKHRCIGILPRPGLEPLSATRATQLRDEGPSDEVLDLVSRVYRNAVFAGERPLIAIERFFTDAGADLPRSTAGRWVALARARGFLGPSKGPGRAAI